MQSNSQLGFSRIARVGNYEVGQKGSTFRAYGYEWDYNQDASRERAHHKVCGRGKTAEDAIDAMVKAAEMSGRTTATVHNQRQVMGLTADECRTLAMELHEAIDELADV
jgi:hypothetical protein